MAFGERLTELRKDNGYKTRKEFCEKIGIPETTLRNYEKNEREPGHLFIKQMSDFFGVSADYLLGLSESKEQKQEGALTLRERNMIEKIRTLDPHGNQMVSYVLDAEYRRVQQILSVSRGETVGDSETIAVPILKNALSHKVVGTVPISAIGKDYGSESDLFALKVTRDTMSPRIAPGDTVIVRKQNDVNSGDIAVVLLDGIQVVCKQVIKDGEMLRLVPLNSQYETMSFRKEDLRKRKLEILGRVIENVQAI